MIRTLRATRSLPSLRTTAISHAAQPVPALPTEFCHGSKRSIATATPRTRKTKASALTEPSSTPLIEPKKRGRPRKNTLAPTTHKRSNSTDSKPVAAKQSRKGDAVPSIPQPSSSSQQSTTQAKSSLKKADGDVRVPTPADAFRAQKADPVATTGTSEISTADPQDLGTRVQAVVSDKTPSEAEKFARRAVKGIEAAGAGIGNVQDLLGETIKSASTTTGSSGGGGGGGGGGAAEKTHQEPGSKRDQQEEKALPQGEKTVLLSMLGLTGLWVAFGGRFQRKSGDKKK